MKSSMGWASGDENAGLGDRPEGPVLPLLWSKLRALSEPPHP